METQEKMKVALVLGATGGIGGAVARGLRRHGWIVRALNRSAEKAARAAPDIEWVQGDAMSLDDVLHAARGVDLIVHAVNPPGYRNWGTLVLPMLENTIAAAKAAGARIVLPGTIYNFGPDAFPVLTEEAPQNPKTEKGLIRKEMELRLKAASQAGVGVIIVRAGDFFGPGAANNWFSQALVKPGKPLTAISYPGRKGVAHQWAYLPDVAETMIRLVERADALPAFAVYHMCGFLDRNGTEMVEAIRRVVAKPDLPVRAFPWWLIGLASLFVPLFRELRAMRYLWREPLRMPNERLVAVLGKEPHTEIDEAIATTLRGLGCFDNHWENTHPRAVAVR
ncbi:NAD(P)H-binding protein [Ensifer sp.]|uniref:NAD(P)H-binding protein n=1 Tax=Ensifer sp. TaxID=1872086 RepID=UPI002E113BFA|nr:NAD(P)H-binding protein [Ensifer sp.]